jgi:signal transduction histidine kinase
MSSISIRPNRSAGRSLPVPGGVSSTLALSLATFAVGVDALLMAGLLPSVADALRLPTGDRSATVFVVAYAVLAPVLAATTRHVPHRLLLTGALVLLGLANLVAALAPSLPAVMAGRVLAALGVAASTPLAAAAGACVLRHRSGMTALPMIIGGAAVATALGLSLGENTGDWFGWRATFGTVALVCLFAGVGMVLSGGFRPYLGASIRPNLSLAASIAVLSAVAGYGAYVYCVPALEVLGVPHPALVLMLFAYGLGAMIVTTVAGLRRAGEERRRIARELHDSLTHNIALIKIQAGIAVHLARQRGEPVPEALLAIEEASSDAMRELRAALHMLRDADGRPAGSGLDHLPDLLLRARSTGLRAALAVDGEYRRLPVEIDRTAYRVVQEALTNVTRHAGDASATVRIEYGRNRLTVRVDDDGRAHPSTPPKPGVGLTGMHERVSAVGGRLQTGPREEGGFTVRADLPLHHRAPALSAVRP